VKGPFVGHCAQADIEQQDAMTKHDDAATAPIVAGIAELESVSTAQGQRAFAIARQREAGDGNRIVEELQIFAATGTTRRRNGGIARLQAVKPQPANRGQDCQAENF
jgi:hypothetical protein